MPRLNPNKSRKPPSNRNSKSNHKSGKDDDSHKPNHKRNNDSHKPNHKRNNKDKDKPSAWSNSMSSIKSGISSANSTISDDFSKFTRSVKNDFDTVETDAKSAGSWWLNYGNPVGLTYNAVKDTSQLPSIFKHDAEVGGTAILFLVLLGGAAIYYFRDDISSAVSSGISTGKEFVSSVASDAEKVAPFALPLAML